LAIKKGPNYCIFSAIIFVKLILFGHCRVPCVKALASICCVLAFGDAKGKYAYVGVP